MILGDKGAAENTEKDGTKRENDIASIHENTFEMGCASRERCSRSITTCNTTCGTTGGTFDGNVGRSPTIRHDWRV